MSDVITFRVSGDLATRLNNLATSTHRTKAFYARQALEHQLDDIEDAYLADEAYREYVAGGRKSRPLQVLCDEMGINTNISEAEAANLLANVR